ncbi:MAG: translation elongation factor Ts [Fimbriimonas ginsengisoli]|uniref:Elongation factor Ts n=1 Tax=Fimbriimonas ginsengisoli TaxID=1005039 RepID=A0A931LRC8_FIMGI|nr:translation elongation factor Ts [Fimbriimonas ginsengisoli]
MSTATYTALAVKRLREETDAPMMECKTALEEAGGDFEKAKNILREKGKAAAAKRADRSTAAGVVAIAVSADGRTAGAAVLECETDFVARNEGFLATAQQLAAAFLASDPGAEPLKAKAGGKTVGEVIVEAVGKIRENIRLSKAVHLSTANRFATYIHHDKLKGTIVEVAGEGDQALETGRQIAIQAVAFPPEVISKDEIPQSKIDAEMEVETQRAINEGKDEKIAKNIAMGRINKEYLKRVVLLEQPFYRDPAISVGQYLKEHGGATIVGFTRLAVGEGG